MTQEDIRSYYRDHWKKAGESRAGDGGPAAVYSSPIEDAVIYPIYEKLIADHGIRADGGHILDVGSGAGRWARFFLDRYTPLSLTGVDFAESSAMLLNDWAGGLETPARVGFATADIGTPGCGIEKPDGSEGYDLINVANVLFHIPEPEKFEQALLNISRLLAPGGRAVSTEYLPRETKRTNWMLVRSRYEFEAACGRAGLEIADVRACSFFSNDPMGIDGPDDGLRARFYAVRDASKQLIGAMSNAEGKRFIEQMFAEIEHAVLGFCAERLAQAEMPAQKLVVLRKKG